MDSSVVERVGVLYHIEVAVVSGEYSRDGRFVEGEVAFGVRYPAEGNMIEDVEDGVRALGRGVRAARTAPDYEGWSNLGPNTSCRNPAQDGFVWTISR